MAGTPTLLRAAALDDGTGVLGSGSCGAGSGSSHVNHVATAASGSKNKVIFLTSEASLHELPRRVFFGAAGGALPL